MRIYIYRNGFFQNVKFGVKLGFYEIVGVWGVSRDVYYKICLTTSNNSVNRMGLRLWPNGPYHFHSLVLGSMLDQYFVVVVKPMKTQ